MNLCDEYEFICLNHRDEDMNGWFLMDYSHYEKLKEERYKHEQLLSFNANHPIKVPYEILRRNEHKYYKFFTKQKRK